MAAGSTYTPLATTTLASASATVTFSSIIGSYTDLIVIANMRGTATGSYPYMQFNSDTGTNYSRTILMGNGSSASSYRGSNQAQADIGDELPTAADTFMNATFNLQNYSNSTTYKTSLIRVNNGRLGYVSANVNLWRSTAAITSVLLGVASGSFQTGSTFTLYGIAAA